jgi:membrane protease YdiL (CAAX protease family)
VVWRGPNYGEVAGVIGTGVLHLVFLKLTDFHVVFIVGAVIGWTSYVMNRTKRDRSLLQTWGFTRTNLGSCFRITATLAAIGFIGMALIGWSRGHLRVHWHMIPLALLYPIWGVIQQFLIQGLVAANLMKDERGPRSPVVAIFVSACLFAFAHVPEVELMTATFLMGAVFTPVYLRYRNIWPLGLFHGWLGLAFYFWVAGRDPVNALLKGFR